MSNTEPTQTATGFVINHKSLSVMSVVLVLGAGIYQFTGFFQKQAFQIERLQEDQARQETQSEKLADQLSKVTDALQAQTRATDLLAFEIKSLKKEK